MRGIPRRTADRVGRSARFLLAALLALAVIPAASQAPIPPVARVTDQAGVLDAAARSALEQRLAALERAKGSQVAVLVLPTTQPETIEQYAIRVAETWRLGRKDVDDGAILLVATEDRAVRIEVGYGLEGAVPDAIAKRIVEETIIPRFRAGDLPGGIQAGVAQLAGVIEGEPLPEPARAAQDRPSPDALIGLVFGTLMFGRVIGRMLGALTGAALAGGIVGIGAFFFIGAVSFAVIAGIVVFVITLFMPLGGAGAMRGGRHGGWGGGGFGGGGLGGGGFRGGGGGFGGGGASGRW